MNVQTRCMIAILRSFIFENTRLSTHMLTKQSECNVNQNSTHNVETLQKVCNLKMIWFQGEY